MNIKVVIKQKEKEISKQGYTVSENTFTLPEILPEYQTLFDLRYVISFDSEIEKVIEFNYKWSDNFDYYIASPLQPKLLKLKCGMYVQASIFDGFWEINPLDKKQLIWNLNPQNAQLLTQYKGLNNVKEYLSVNAYNPERQFKLLFSREGGVIWSRSQIPFSAIVCFTDHCDFDTLENLKIQRDLFKQTKVKVTKGYFLNHFSKREDNASYEYHSDELQEWEKDGHEMAYHSLSQSIKDLRNSFSDFHNFKSPFKHSPTWIDHGFQPYNLSLTQSNGIELVDFFKDLKSKGIQNLWNYIDSATSNSLVYNQLDRKQFTLETCWKALKNERFKDKYSKFIKNIMFHYYSESDKIETYKSIAASFKHFVKEKSIKSFFRFVLASIKIGRMIISLLLHWKKSSKKIYPLAKYNTVLFPKIDDNEKFWIFQTLEVLDFKSTFKANVLEKIIDDCAVLVAHTYFSVPFGYHKGKMIIDNEIDSEVYKNIKTLGNSIFENKIWNPTLHEFVTYWNQIYETEFMNVPEKGIVSNNLNLTIKKVQ